MKENGAVDELRKALQSWEKWWDSKYQSLAESDGLPQVKAWELVQYHEIKTKMLACLRQAIAEGENKETGS
jgi:hypothetical protein